MDNTYLLEIGVEEFPAAYVKSTKDQLRDAFEKTLNEHEIDFENIEVHSSPRRFSVIVPGLKNRSSEKKEEVKGPALKISYGEDKEPSKALLGFLRGQGMELSDVYVKEVSGTEYVFVEKCIKQASFEDVLKENVPQIIKGLSFPKTMKWGGKDIRFARPIRWIVSLLDDKVLDFDLEGIKLGRTSKGHRVLGKSEFEIDKVENYIDLLKENGVILLESERRSMILHGANKLAREKNGNLYKDEALLEEIINITEYPTPLLGDVDEKYLSLPKEVIITPMKDHQRYFPVIDDSGKLLPYFVTVRNGDTKGLDEVKKGNEKVLAPRLEDANFFYQEDISKKLEGYRDILKTASFHDKLGTIYDKSLRVEKLSSLIGGKLAVGDETIENTKRAASLAKCDLVTKTVIEFTELQGIMGEIYALESGENPIVAQAIREHYMPRFAGDELPKSTAGKVLSIADKLDTIVGMYAVGIKVTGSQDPYALRRQMLGIINIIIQNMLEVDIKDLVSDSLFTYLDTQKLVFDHDLVIEEIMEFIKQRLRVMLIEEGMRYDVVDACFKTGFTDLYVTRERVKAVNDWIIEKDEEYIQVLTRLENIVSDKDIYEINDDLISEEAELNLLRKMSVVEEISCMIEKKDFKEALEMFDTLKNSINNFLDNVMVMVDDENIRNNRIGLLANIYKEVKRLFIPSLIVKEGK